MAACKILRAILMSAFGYESDLSALVTNLIYPPIIVSYNCNLLVINWNDESTSVIFDFKFNLTVDTSIIS